MIVDDIVKRKMAVITSLDTYGRKLLIFLETISFLGDYEKMALLGLFCTQYIYILRQVSLPKNTKYLGPKYAPTWSIHSRRLVFMQCDERLSEL